MFIIRGVNVFPSQIETAILSEGKQLLQYQIVLTRTHSLDNMEVQIELTPEMVSDKVSEIEAIAKRFSKAIEKIINIRAAVRMMPPNSIPRSTGKAKRVVDNRNA